MIGQYTSAAVYTSCSLYRFWEAGGKEKEIPGAYNEAYREIRPASSK